MIVFSGLLLGSAGCREPVPGLGEPCTLLCATFLTCSNEGYCEKQCFCDGDGGTSCIPSTITDGCPPRAICVVTGGNGRGHCVATCEGDLGCPPGQPGCTEMPDDIRACVGDGSVGNPRDMGAR